MESTILFRKNLKQIMLVCFLFLGAGCQKASLKLTFITELSGVSLDQNYKTLSTSSDAVIVTGKCNKNFSTIEVSANSGATWTSIRVLNPSSVVDCSKSGVFSFSFVPSNASSTLASQIDSGNAVVLLLRGNGSSGFSTNQSLSISRFGATPGQTVTYGNDLTTVGTLRLTGRLTASASQAYYSNGSYALKSTIRNR